MDEVIKDIKNNPQAVIDLLTRKTKNQEEIIQHREEYADLRRNIRQTQIDNTQKNKTNPSGVSIVQSRIPVPFQKKIVDTATAFEAGEGVLLTPNEDNGLSQEILRLWRTNRIDSKFLELIRLKKSETESAISFYIEDLKDNNLFNRVRGVNKNKEIKTTILSSETGQMTPFYDSATGDMKAFVWRYSVEKGDKKTNHTWIYDDTYCYKMSDDTGQFKLDSTTKHGFSKIPVVYFDQAKPEWFDVEYMIDRFETAISKLSDSNDYSGHPMLKLYGEVVTMPKKEDNGKTLRFPVKVTKDGKEIKGDAEFLTNTNAPESVRLELEKLEKLINYLTSTPQMSLEDLKGVGAALSGVAIKLMFLDAMIKAKLNEGGNRTSIERIINILISGTVTTTVVSLKEKAKTTFFDVKFKSIIPTDVKEAIDYLAVAVENGIVSQKTAVNQLGFTDNTDEEIAQITKEKEAAAELEISVNTTITPQAPTQE